MYEVIGHDAVRFQLKNQSDSFCLHGPEGVGRTGIIAEWSQDKTFEYISSFDVSTVKNLVKRSYVQDMFFIVDSDKGGGLSWMPLLKPLEENQIKLAIISTKPLPLPVQSRINTFQVGYLHESDVVKILSKDFPKLKPRPWIAKAAMGTMKNVKILENVIDVFESLDQALTNGYLADEVQSDPLATFQCLRLACLSKLGYSSLPFSFSAVSRLPHHLAISYLALPDPATKNEARNTLNIFFAQVLNV